MEHKLPDSAGNGELVFDNARSSRLKRGMKAFRLLVILCSLSSSAIAAGVGSTSRIYTVDWNNDLYLTAGALALGAVPYLATDRLTSNRCPCPLNELNEWDRTVVGNRNNTALTFTDIGISLAIATPYVLSYVERGTFDDIFWEEALLYTEVLATAGALTAITKHLVQRPLPRTYDLDPELINDPAGYRSFFSGHTALTAAALAASAFTLRMRDRSGAWIWALPIGAATLVGAGRIAGGVHFYTDVITGLGVGMAAGVLIPYLHQLQTPNQSWYILPDRGGFAAIWTKRL